MDYFKKLVGNQPSQVPLQPDDGFADYAAPAAASPISIPSSIGDTLPATQTGAPVPSRQMVYTKWYRIWERTELSDFYFEMFMIPFIVVALAVHFLGTRRNRRKARKFMAAATPILENEFALVGFGNHLKDVPYQEGAQGDNALIAAAAKLPGDKVGKDILKEKTAFEYESYASGRANTAFMDIKILLWKWYNPMLLLVEFVMGLFFETMKPHPERIEVISYSFDGNEKAFVGPQIPGTEELAKARGATSQPSTYDAFIFAIVNKLSMRRLRDDRYDLSLTFTKDNAKLPVWSSVMSESAEITDIMLTKDLIAAIELASDHFEYLIVTDQPIEKPTTLEEAKPRKRLHLCFRLPSDNSYAKVLPLLQAFLRLSDHLASAAKFRPEVTKKIKQTRENESAKLKKVASAEAEEERLRQLEKLKKDERDRKLNAMSAEDQRKFKEKEAEKERRKKTKKMTMKG